MASSDWNELVGSVSSGSVVRGVTAGIPRPNGGGNQLYAMNSIEVVTGAVGLFANSVGFAPATSGLTVRGAIQRGVSGGATNFAPFLFAALQGDNVADTGYLLGLSDGDPHRIALVKGILTDGIPNDEPDAPNNTVLMRSTASYLPGTWLHLRMDVIVQGSGDCLVQVYANDLDTNSVIAPVWELIPGMEGPQSPTLYGYVDDFTQVNTGSAPLVGGRVGWGMQATDTARRAYWDQITIGIQ